ncbi:hypothetical protein [Thiolapillus sp.]
MYLLTDKARLYCAHQTGRVQLKTSQSLLRIEGDIVLVKADPVGCAISGCTNSAAGNFPCTLTLNVKRGYSNLVRIEGHPVTLKHLVGLTNGTLPGTVEYKVADPGQNWVSETI